MATSSERWKKVGKTLLKVVLWIVGIWLVLIIALQIVMSPKMLTKIVNNVTTGLVEGDLEFGRVSASVFRHFPYVTVSLDSVSITYPTERFAEFETGGSPLLQRGKGEVQDTLASVSKFSAAVNVWALVGGTISVPYVGLEKPRIYAKVYRNGDANWNIFNIGSDEEEETVEEVVEEADTVKSEFNLPQITLNRMALSKTPVVVFCSQRDSISATLVFRNLKFGGKLTTKDLSGNKLGFSVDSLFIAAKVSADTLSFGLDNFTIKQNQSDISLQLNAKARMYNRTLGRITVPIDVSGRFSFPKDTVPAVSVSELNARVAGIPFAANLDAKYYTDSLWVNAQASIEKCKVGDILKYYGKNFWKEASEFKTDAVLTMTASVDGWYDMGGGRLPAIDFSFSVPDTPVSYKPAKLNTNFGIDLWANGGAGKPFKAGVKDFHITDNTIQIAFNGDANDLLGKDPAFNVDASLSVALDSLAGFFSKQLGMDVSGKVAAKVTGSAKSSQLNIYKLADADLGGFVRTTGLNVSSPKDSLEAHIDSLDIVLGMVGNKLDEELAQGERVMVLGIIVDSTDISYKDVLKVTGKDLAVKVQNDAAVLSANDTSSFYPFRGGIEIGRLTLKDSGTTSIVLANSNNSFTVMPNKEDPSVPKLSIDSSMGVFGGKLGYNRAGVRNLSLNLSATKNLLDESAQRRKVAKAFIDSVTRKYPDIPRESIVSFILQQKEAQQMRVPDWLSEDDFKKSDLDFKLDETLARYYKEWEFSGTLGLDNATVLTPVLPLKNELSNFYVNVNNEAVTLHRFTLKSGKSNISAGGMVSGLRSALLDNGILKMDLKISSDSLNVNEMIAAAMKGSEIMDKLNLLGNSVDEMSDDEYSEMITVDTLSTIPENALLVIPANINAEATLDVNNVSYAKFFMNKLHAKAVMKERCLQLIDTYADTNFGDMSLEAFYSTRTKEDLSAGFNLTMKDITADEIIDMLPAVDSLMPMLKSFHGMLNLELAATTSIDTTMTIIPSSLNGILRIGGKNLALVDSEDLQKILKMLMFKNVKDVEIADMSVEGVIGEGQVEVFPFVLTADRYSVAMSGIQNLDSSFKYHISVLKSPLIIRFGINLFGDDFDNMKFRIGKAQYKSASVPVFSAVIDETKINLSEAIRDIFGRSVDSVIQFTKENAAIMAKKKELGYVNPAEVDIEELDEGENELLGKEESDVSAQAPENEASVAEGTEAVETPEDE